MTQVKEILTESDDSLYDDFLIPKIYLNLETGSLSAELQEPGVTLGEVFHGNTLAWDIPPLKKHSLKKLFQEIKKNCQELVDLREERSIDFENTELRIEAHLENERPYWTENEVWQVWEAAKYFEPIDILTEYNIPLSLVKKENEPQLNTKAQEIIEQNEQAHLDLDDTKEYILMCIEEALEDQE